MFKKMVAAVRTEAVSGKDNLDKLFAELNEEQAKAREEAPQRALAEQQKRLEELKALIQGFHKTFGQETNAEKIKRWQLILSKADCTTDIKQLILKQKGLPYTIAVQCGAEPTLEFLKQYIEDLTLHHLILLIPKIKNHEELVSVFKNHALYANPTEKKAAQEFFAFRNAILTMIIAKALEMQDSSIVSHLSAFEGLPAKALDFVIKNVQPDDMQFLVKPHEFNEQHLTDLVKKCQTNDQFDQVCNIIQSSQIEPKESLNAALKEALSKEGFLSQRAAQHLFQIKGLSPELLKDVVKKCSTDVGLNILLNREKNLYRDEFVHIIRSAALKDFASPARMEIAKEKIKAVNNLAPEAAKALVKEAKTADDRMLAQAQEHISDDDRFVLFKKADTADEMSRYLTAKLLIADPKRFNGLVLDHIPKPYFDERAIIQLLSLRPQSELLLGLSEPVLKALARKCQNAGELTIDLLLAYPLTKTEEFIQAVLENPKLTALQLQTIFELPRTSQRTKLAIVERILEMAEEGTAEAEKNVNSLLKLENLSAQAFEAIARKSSQLSMPTMQTLLANNKNWSEAFMLEALKNNNLSSTQLGAIFKHAACSEPMRLGIAKRMLENSANSSQLDDNILCILQWHDLSEEMVLAIAKKAVSASPDTVMQMLNSPVNWTDEPIQEILKNPALNASHLAKLLENQRLGSDSIKLIAEKVLADDSNKPLRVALYKHCAFSSEWLSALKTRSGETKSLGFSLEEVRGYLRHSRNPNYGLAIAHLSTSGVFRGEGTEQWKNSFAATFKAFQQPNGDNFFVDYIKNNHAGRLSNLPYEKMMRDTGSVHFKALSQFRDYLGDQQKATLAELFTRKVNEADNLSDFAGILAFGSYLTRDHQATLAELFTRKINEADNQSNFEEFLDYKFRTYLTQDHVRTLASKDNLSDTQKDQLMRHRLMTWDIATQNLYPEFNGLAANSPEKLALLDKFAGIPNLGRNLVQYETNPNLSAETIQKILDRSDMTARFAQPFFNKPNYDGYVNSHWEWLKSYKKARDPDAFFSSLLAEPRDKVDSWLNSLYQTSQAAHSALKHNSNPSRDEFLVLLRRIKYKAAKHALKAESLKDPEQKEAEVAAAKSAFNVYWSLRNTVVAHFAKAKHSQQPLDWKALSKACEDHMEAEKPVLSSPRGHQAKKTWFEILAFLGKVASFGLAAKRLNAWAEFKAHQTSSIQALGLFSKSLEQANKAASAPPLDNADRFGGPNTPEYF